MQCFKGSGLCFRVGFRVWGLGFKVLGFLKPLNPLPGGVLAGVLASTCHFTFVTGKRWGVSGFREHADL